MLNEPEGTIKGRIRSGLARLRASSPPKTSKARDARRACQPNTRSSAARNAAPAALQVAIQPLRKRGERCVDVPERETVRRTSVVQPPNLLFDQNRLPYEQ